MTRRPELQCAARDLADARTVETDARAIDLPARYDYGMTRAAKITISLPQEQVRQAREAVAKGEASSVSGYISAALAAVAPAAGDTDEDTMADFVADLIAENGPPSAAAYAWADRVLAMSEPD
jgi:Arc/MetJ-type ribon-helix-helix transcriptional regulator